MMELFFALPVVAFGVCVVLGFWRPGYAIVLSLVFLALSGLLASGAREAALAVLPHMVLSGLAVFTTVVQLITRTIALRSHKS
jgi:hypothetical protein